VGTLYSCTAYVGFTNLFAMLLEAPELIDYLSARLLEQAIESLRRLAARGATRCTLTTRPRPAT